MRHQHLKQTSASAQRREDEKADKMDCDGNVLGITAGLLASIVLLILFQSIRWLFAPLAVVVLALWSTRGLLATVGQKLTRYSNNSKNYP